MQKLKTFALLTGGTLITVTGIYFFKFPNNFSTGGVSGISLILSSLFPSISAGTFVWIINILLLILGLIIVGRDFTVKTVYCSLLMSFSLRLLEIILPLNAPLTNQPFLELCFAVLLPAIGSAILFNCAASTGGTDITAMILKKYTSLNIGRALLIVDIGVTFSAFFVFGITVGMFSVLGLVAKTVVVDNVIESFHMSKYLFIITNKPDDVGNFITKLVHKDATTWECRGFYTGESRTLMLTVMRRSQALFVRKYVREIDPNSFIVMSNSSEIIGKGFRNQF